MTKARRRLEPDERRIELIEAAERVLRKKGAAGRVEDVVRAAGAAKGTFYLYFDSWEDLLLAIRARVYESFDRRILMHGVLESEVAWWAFMDRFLDGFVDFVTELEGLHEVLFRGPLVSSVPVAKGQGAVGRIAGLIREGIEAGVFADVDPEPTARMLFAAIHEATDAILAGADRKAYLTALRSFVRRALGCAALKE